MKLYSDRPAKLYLVGKALEFVTENCEDGGELKLHFDRSAKF